MVEILTLKVCTSYEHPDTVGFTFCLGSFFKGGHPSHDDYGKTIDDVEKRFFAFNCQLKKLNFIKAGFFSTQPAIRANVLENGTYDSKNYNCIPDSMS